MNKTGQKDTLFVGHGPEMDDLYGRLKRPERVLGLFCSLEDSSRTPFCECLGDVTDVPGYLTSHPQVRRVYCRVCQMDSDMVRSILSACKVRGVKFCAVLPVVNGLEEDFVPMHVSRQLLLTPRPEPLSKVYNLVLKRLSDIIIALLLLLTVFPLVYLVRYIMVRVRRQGAVLCMDAISGPDGKVFSRLLFRREGDGSPGKWASMPQLLNVLAGQMSLVGPAPVPAALQDVRVPEVRLERRSVKCGMTGWSQLKRCEGGGQVLAADIWYVGHWSLWLDLKILVRSLS